MHLNHAAFDFARLFVDVLYSGCYINIIFKQPLEIFAFAAVYEYKKVI